jgi:hypothetical protein
MALEHVLGCVCLQQGEWLLGVPKPLMNFPQVIQQLLTIAAHYVDRDIDHRIKRRHKISDPIVKGVI